MQSLRGPARASARLDNGCNLRFGLPRAPFGTRLPRAAPLRPGRRSGARQVPTRAILAQAPAPSAPQQSEGQQTQRSSSPDLPKDLMVPVHFTWPGGGDSVELYGSWNDWSAPVRMHQATTGQPHRAIIPLRLGPVQYKFKVDGVWRTDRTAQTVTNSDKVLNNFLIVYPSLEFQLKAPDAQHISVVGDWDNWQYSLPLTRDPSNSGVWQGCTNLQPGQYCYQYVVDNRLMHDPLDEAGVYPGRGVVNMGWAVEQPVFRLFYASGWDEVNMHWRRVRPDKSVEDGFHVQKLMHASSKGPDGGLWHMGVVVPLNEGEGMEFFLSNGKKNGDAKEDRPGSEEAKRSGVNTNVYRMPRPGSFKLHFGKVRPFPRGAEARYMLVSDIDGTMIGPEHQKTETGEDGFASSKRFSAYWENGPALSGSVLVYNTGRSVGHVRELLTAQVEKVCSPDALIVAVGTKVFFKSEEVSRQHPDSGKWVEDLEYTRSLDAGWNLDVVRKVADRCLDKYQRNTALITTLDDGREHQHRYSFCAQATITEDVAYMLWDGCKRRGVDARVIVSGAGSHRHIDCVAINGGKEKALQYIRAKYGIPEHSCVAAGDSGNDVLMLQGEHPSIVVGNAQEDLLMWLNDQPQDGKIILADAFYADGIMEGLARHGLY